jgi:hypothetical protein
VTQSSDLCDGAVLEQSRLPEGLLGPGMNITMGHNLPVIWITANRFAVNLASKGKRHDFFIRLLTFCSEGGP